jgi:hypothetical protein
MMFDFVRAHGGWAGDAKTNPGTYAFDVLFNRWALHGGAEPMSYYVFKLLHLPAFALARFTYDLIEITIPEFRDGFPYGQSWRTYEFVLFLCFGFAQWYFVGWLVDRRMARK